MNRRAWVLALVVALHAVLLRAVWLARFERPDRLPTVISVALLSEPTPVPKEVVPPVPPVRLAAPVPVVLTDSAPVIQAPVAEVAQGAVEQSGASPNPATPARSTAPETLGTELALQCPDRTPPRYPPLAKHDHEQGEVRLRVELDESGRVDRVTVVSSSGSPRLDEAARLAIESWHCRPAERLGQPVRAVAMQSLAFVLGRR